MLRAVFIACLPATLALAEDAVITEPAPAAGYDSGFFIHSDDGRFRLTTNMRVQGRFTAASVNPGGGLDRENSTAFTVHRARLVLGGHAFSEDLVYRFQADVGGQGTFELRDYYIDYRPVSGNPVVIRVGQYKRPFSRQQITSSGRQELVDRAITNGFFDAGRDIGVMVHNNYASSPAIEWAAGVFNGRGESAEFDGAADPMTGEVNGRFTNVPADIQPAVVVRGGYNHGGILGYSEADLEGGPLRFAVGGSLLVGFDGDGGDDGRIQAQVDGVVKAEGLSVGAGLYLAAVQDGADFVDQGYAAVGAHVQGGYLIAGKLQPTLRYAFVAPDGLASFHEVSAGFAVYQFKHNFKLSSDVGLRGSGDDLADGLLARSQLQLAF